MSSLKNSIPKHLQWISSMCETAFFAPCESHSTSGKGELLNLFSIERERALCPCCCAEDKVSDAIQIRRSSYHNVVRVQDVSKAVNCSQIQTYIINSARVVFLNERPHPRGKNGEHKKASQQSAANGGACKHCLRTLQADSVSFCSIACKAIGGGDMQPNAESMRLLEETVMKQHVAIPRNSQNKSNNNSNNNYNNLNNNNNNNNNDDDGQEGGGPLTTSLPTSSSGGASIKGPIISHKNGIGGQAQQQQQHQQQTKTKRAYQTKAKKALKKKMNNNNKKSVLVNTATAMMKNGQSNTTTNTTTNNQSSFATPATSSLGVTPEATPNDGILATTTAAAAATSSGRRLNNNNGSLIGHKRNGSETPSSILTPMIPIVPNRRKKHSAPRKSPDN